MADENDPKKKSEQTDPSVIKIPKHIGTAGSIDNFIDTGYKGPFEITGKAYNLDTGVTIKKDIRAGGAFVSFADETTIHGARFGGVQRIDIADQSAILGASSVLGKNLLEMKLNTIGDERNFLVGVNNFASVFSENSGLLKSIESASAIALTHGRIATEAIDRFNIPVMTKGIELATAYHLDGRQMVKLSESVTTVLAYGKAVQTQFDSIVGSETFKNGIITLRDASATLEKVSAHIPTYIGSEAITSPFFYEPQKVKTKEVEKVLPELKKELPEKTTEAIEMIEYFRNPDTKKGDTKVLTTLNEIKRAIENVVGFSTMVIQQTTIKQLVIGKNKEPLIEDLVVGPLTYRKDGAILYKQTPIKMRFQIKNLCILFMKNHKNYVDYSTIKDELVSAEKRPTTSFETITKYVSELHKLLQNHFKREVIFNQEKDGYIFDTERNS